MAALSYYSNWETFDQHEFDSDMSILAQAETQLLFNNYFAFPDYNYCNNMDHLFESKDDLLYSEGYNSLFPYPSTPPDYNLNHSLNPESEPFNCLKRQKVYDYEQNHIKPQPGLTNIGIQDYPPEVMIPTLPHFSTAPVYNGGSCETATKPTSGGSLSAQSIAARQRRRKITEKTHQLGKLIPGGTKMNTAEMFEAAYKYIKYLQAQVGILEFMSSYHQENGNSFQSEELYGFLESPLIQEKLYFMEKCMVPQKFMQELATDNSIFVSKTQVLKEVRQLCCIEN